MAQVAQAGQRYIFAFRAALKKRSSLNRLVLQKALGMKYPQRVGGFSGLDGI